MTDEILFYGSADATRIGSTGAAQPWIENNPDVTRFHFRYMCLFERDKMKKQNNRRREKIRQIQQVKPRVIDGHGKFSRAQVALLKRSRCGSRRHMTESHFSLNLESNQANLFPK